MEAQDLSLRVSSFSCYLKNNEDSFVQKIWPGPSTVKISKTNGVITADNGGIRVNNNNNFTFNSSAASSAPVQDPTVAFILPQQQHIITNNPPKSSQKDGGEFSIFKATDKYFNATNLSSGHTTTTVPGGIKYTNVLRGQERHFKSATPSVCSSEYSSCQSSQIALLPNIIKQKKGINKTIGKRIFFGFGCRPSLCSDKRAVFISESKRVEHLATTFATSRGILRDENKNNCMVEPRKSLEVFGADKVTNKKSGVTGVAINLQRKLSMLTWDAIPNNAQNNPFLPPPIAPTTTTISNTIICDDRASDASSDLFEIENISTTTGYGSFVQTADYASGCSSPTTQYAPSEASIQWSVVTASAADYASVVSDYNYCDEKCNDTKYNGAAKANNINSATKKPSPKNRPSRGGLLGCNNHKAASVVESVPHKAKLGKHAELSFA